MKWTYADAGVNIEAGNQAVQLIKEKVRNTFRPEVLGEVGGFGGLFALDVKKYKEPVLVAGADGVGTKLKVAMLMGKHDSIGIDAVAMCVNDIIVQGAEPLFFLDYLAVGKLVPERVAQIIGGVAEGCRQAGCALIGGETAEMPGFYRPDEYDLAGFAVGVVDKKKLIDGQAIRPGEVIVGLPSSGLHSNGYSLARKVLLDVGKYRLDEYLPELGRTVGEELLVPTRIYVKLVLCLLKRFNIHGLAHITGGGLIENIPRILPKSLSVLLKHNSWLISPIFALIQRTGQIEINEMFRTFNMGIGMVLVVPEEEAPGIMSYLSSRGETAYLMGKVVKSDGAGKVEIS